MAPKKLGFAHLVRYSPESKKTLLQFRKYNLERRNKTASMNVLIVLKKERYNTTYKSV